MTLPPFSYPKASHEYAQHMENSSVTDICNLLEMFVVNYLIRKELTYSNMCKL